MSANIFISYDHDDQDQVNGFKGLIRNPNHPLEAHDHSLKEAVRDASGKIIKYLPSDARSKPVREEIISKFEKCSRLVVLIGNHTHQSEWVEWEVNTFFEMKKKIPNDVTWKRIRGMRLKGKEGAITPKALMNGRSTVPMDWNPEALDKWLDTNTN